MSGDIELPDATESTAATAPTTQASSTAQPKKKRKRTPKNHVLNQFTIRDPPWAYLHLQRVTSNGTTSPVLDATTVHLQLASAQSRFLGLHGQAISVDILKIKDADLWIRVPADDRSAIIAAISGWVSSKGEGWQVKGWSSWDARAMARDSGQDLFNG